MGKIIQIFSFGGSYFRRYWVRLTVGVLCGALFGLSNVNFMWAAKTLAERFNSTPPVKIEKASPAGWESLTAQLTAARDSVNQTIEPWLPRSGRALDWQQVLGLLLFLPLLVTLRGICDYLNNYCMGWVGERVVRDVRLDLMEKLSSLSLDFFNRTSTGELLTRINMDTTNLLRSFRSGAADMVKESVTVVAVFGYLCWLDWKMTLCTVILLPACLLPLFILGRKARVAMRTAMRTNSAQSGQLIELLTSIRTIKSFNMEAEEMARFRRSSNELVRSGMKGVQAKETVGPLIELIATLGAGGLLLYVFYIGRSGAEVTAFLMGMFLFFNSLKKLSNLHILFEQAGVAVVRIQEILSEQPKVVEPASPKPFAQFTHGITFENVTFAYKDRDVVRELNCEIPRGVKLGIAGESGSGKTTFVNLLFRFYDPTGGSLKIDGLDLREISIRALREQMALVSQDVVLFDQTIAENIACGKIGASREEIITAAKAAFAHDFIMQLPQGYETRSGERGVTLSGGQRQRIAIARAFIRNAPILVLDEATASLDSKAEAQVQAAIDRLAEHRTVICVAHRLSTLAGMDKILVLAEGRQIEFGSFEELLKQNGGFAEMCRRQGIFSAPER